MKKGLDLISVRISRWVVSLQDYDYTVRDVPGAYNKVADCLSRLSVEVEVLQEKEIHGDVSVCMVTGSVIKHDEWLKAVGDDEILQRVCELIRGGWRNDVKQDKDLVSFRRVKDELSVEDGILLRGLRSKGFQIGDKDRFNFYSDMSTAAAQRRRAFKTMLDLFKKQGMQAALVQQFKLEVLVNSQ
ncbi:hypothetical protein NDU88_001663 [Pleurodeles waltl]|uniref:Uncharacterized protein n=1 Tax=Pleurodeles waltl TaxID=8319 RepID=A0AAV7VAX1_PLEWA|nr:hypothetical protein NDU88_001663 [Pleurodeles waltl]